VSSKNAYAYVVDSANFFQDTAGGQPIEGSRNMWAGIVFYFDGNMPVGVDQICSKLTNWYISLTPTANRVRLLFKQADLSNKTVDSINGLVPNKINTVVLAANNTTLKVYINGVDESAASVTLTGDIRLNGQVISIGDDVVTGTRPVVGLAGSSSNALSGAEILAWHLDCKNGYTCAPVTGKTEELWVAGSSVPAAWTGTIASTTLEKTGTPTVTTFNSASSPFAG
jgi:hypothetical protein